MSKPGTPTKCGAIEAINGWIKEGLFLDFKINSCDEFSKQIEDYIHYFNYERTTICFKISYSIQFKNYYYNKREINLS